MNAALGLLSALFLVVLVVILATSSSKVKEEYVNERPTIAIVTLPEYEQGTKVLSLKKLLWYLN